MSACVLCRPRRKVVARLVVQALQRLVELLQGGAGQVEEEPVEGVGLEEAEENDLVNC